MPSKQADRRKHAKQRDALEFRQFAVRADSVNADERTVETVITSETPVPMMDWERWEVIPEVLRADGAILPDQVPLLDSHQRWSMENQYGSTRSIRAEKGEVVGTLHFSSDEASVRAFLKVREGHATDVSAGYQVLEKTFVPRGQKQTVKGREYTGPVNVATKWRLREVSLTPIGADEQAKLRGFDAFEVPQEEGFKMNEQLRKLLESRGMPKDLSDDDAQRWAVENNFGERKATEGDEKGLIDKARAEFEKSVEAKIEAAAQRALEKAEQSRIELRNIADSVLKLANVERSPELNAKLDACRSREDIEKAVLDFRTEQAEKFPTRQHVVTAGPQQREKFEAGLRTAIIERCLDAVPAQTPLLGEEDSSGVRARREAAVNRIFPVDKRSKDAVQFRNGSLYDLARTYVEQTFGVRSLDYSRDDIAVMALFGPQRAAEVLGLDLREAAYHVTGSFANLTLDAMNKSMMLGYTEAPSTWEQVMRVGADASDFKQLHRLRLGAIPNLPIWPDNTEPNRMSIADAREQYAVESRSASIDFSYRLLINDDMDALSRVPGQMGAAARRTVNKYAWSIITSNPTMSDGVALFSDVSGNRKRKNLTTGAGAPATATLQTLSNLMMQMRGENTPENGEGDDVLSIMPRYIVGPSALYTTIVQLVRSQFDVADANMKFNTASGLIPVIEPLLDTNSTVAWYLFADPSQIDTVEVTFLQGQRTPVTRQELDISTLSQKVYVLQTFGAKALNHRGIQKHKGEN